MNKVEINIQSKMYYIQRINIDWPVPEIRELIQAVLKYLNLRNKSISFLICDNDYIQELNKCYRQKDYPTDVLSFESGSDTFLGDIAISLEKVLEQSLEYEVSFGQELKRLVIHGILHLIGYDHERSQDDEKVMFDLENKIFLEV